ncbi:hypothetical protein DMN91_012564 [Ooceraea biroi]|uniref:Uncharacterized protein n=1 Tax=Ooceraea biroi TaxID=2015173 RepID=A0A3L8D598_OOCBI|nr:hypothetical protein DMN91_012564 [Ooceraea biroi]
MGVTRFSLFALEALEGQYAGWILHPLGKGREVVRIPQSVRQIAMEDDGEYRCFATAFYKAQPVLKFIAEVLDIRDINRIGKTTPQFSRVKLPKKSGSQDRDHSFAG